LRERVTALVADALPVSMPPEVDVYSLIFAIGHDDVDISLRRTQ
jgi:hypothetical protein